MNLPTTMNNMREHKYWEHQQKAMLTTAYPQLINCHISLFSAIWKSRKVKKNLNMLHIAHAVRWWFRKLNEECTHVYVSNEISSSFAHCQRLFYKDEEDIIPGFNIPIWNHHPTIFYTLTQTHRERKNADNLIKWNVIKCAQHTQDTKRPKFIETKGSAHIQMQQ